MTTPEEFDAMHPFIAVTEVRLNPERTMLARKIPDEVIEAVQLAASWMAFTMRAIPPGGWLSVHLLTDDEVSDWTIVSLPGKRD